jgi:hypothetical protein
MGSGSDSVPALLRILPRLSKDAFPLLDCCEKVTSISVSGTGSLPGSASNSTELCQPFKARSHSSRQTSQQTCSPTFPPRTREPAGLPHGPTGPLGIFQLDEVYGRPGKAGATTQSRSSNPTKGATERTLAAAPFEAWPIRVCRFNSYLPESFSKSSPSRKINSRTSNSFQGTIFLGESPGRLAAAPSFPISSIRFLALSSHWWASSFFPSR